MLDVPEFNTSIEDAPREPSGPGLRRFVAVLVLVAAAAFGAHYYLGRAAAIAASDRAAGVKPVLLMFTADWCQPCQNFKGTVLADDRVVNAVVGSCKLQMVDLTKWEGPNAERAKHYGVDAIPTLILVNSRGQEFGRYDGPHDPAEFTAWLNAHTR